ncbi:hypothetical protein RND81_06G171300 [Saponaria officinalis]|uniref:Retrotransposon Copia-like N-terminal domain-containing protein n=1 Tax=Saponaria officinalis TaxID=3572 RepID=A0AAW1KB23_SAPOF
MQLVNTVFNGRNYMHWSRGIVMALGSKNKEGFLSGKTAMPESNSPKLPQWKRCDNTVRCWILNTLNVDIKEGFMSSKSAKSLWNEIKERCGQSNGPLIYQLKKELRNISQDNSSVAEYFTKLKRDWDDIEELESIPECECGVMDDCTCQILKKLLDIASKEKVMTFLMGLHDSYDVLRTNILSMEPMPTINKAYSIVQQIESQKQISNVLNLHQDVSALAVHKHPGGYQPSVSWRRDHKKARVDDRWCTQCKKQGHTKETRFRLHPEQKHSFQNRSGFNSFPKHGGQRYNAHNAEVTQGTPFDNISEQHNQFSLKTWQVNELQKFDPAMLTAVYHHMLGMMQSGHAEGVQQSGDASIDYAGKIVATATNVSISACDSMTWIVDSGATDHMVARRDVLINSRVLPQPILVGLPDETTRTVTEVGEVQIHPEILLHDVLFVPGFKHSLMSVGKLLARDGLLIHFDVHHYMIQDHAEVTLLLGQKEEGLYKVRHDLHQNNSRICSVISDSSVCQT